MKKVKKSSFSSLNFGLKGDSFFLTRGSKFGRFLKTKWANERGERLEHRENESEGFPYHFGDFRSLKKEGKEEDDNLKLVGV